MSNLYVLPYKMSSQSAKALARGLECKRLHRDRAPRPKRNSILINWGCGQGNTHETFTDLDLDPFHNVVNPPEHIEEVRGKLKFFEFIDGFNCDVVDGFNINIPQFTELKGVALGWLAEGKTVVCRASLTGSGGRGITLVKGDEELPDVPLYTVYIKKNQEYRVHMGKFGAFDIQQKKVKRGFESPNYQVRNHDNGFVFCREDLDVPEVVLEEAEKLIYVMNLDLYAVDIIYNSHYNQATVLEVNTAPGLEGATLDKYINEIKENIGE